jgi:RNA polymerase sigma-70 factor (ECF subfamily)
LTDTDLLRGAQRGDSEAWRALYQRYLPAVWRQAYAAVGDAHTAEDITSETMLALLQGIGELEGETPRLAGWLRTVVHRKAMDYHRRSFRTREKSSCNSSDLDGGAFAVESIHPLETDEIRGQVLCALNGISDKHRLVLEWKYLDNLGVREIAERLGETEKAVESELYRARRSFRRRFERESSGASGNTLLGADPAQDAHS